MSDILACFALDHYRFASLPMGSLNNGNEITSVTAMQRYHSLPMGRIIGAALNNPGFAAIGKRYESAIEQHRDS